MKLLLIPSIFLTILVSGFGQINKMTVLHPDIKEEENLIYSSFYFEEFDYVLIKDKFNEKERNQKSFAYLYWNEEPDDELILEIDYKNPDMNNPYKYRDIPGLAYEISIYESFYKDQDMFAGNYYFVIDTDTEEEKDLGNVYFKPRGETYWRLIGKSLDLDRAIYLGVTHNSIFRASEIKEDFKIEKLYFVLLMQSISHRGVSIDELLLEELIEENLRTKKYFNDYSYLKKISNLVMTLESKYFGLSSLGKGGFKKGIINNLHLVGIHDSEEQIAEVLAGMYEW